MPGLVSTGRIPDRFDAIPMEEDDGHECHYDEDYESLSEDPYQSYGDFAVNTGKSSVGGGGGGTSIRGPKKDRSKNGGGNGAASIYSSKHVRQKEAQRRNNNTKKTSRWKSDADRTGG